MRIASMMIIPWLTTLALVGCSSADESLPSEADDERSSPRSDAPGGGVIEPVLRIDIAPGTARDFEGARDDVVDEVCSIIDGVWVTEGSLKNPTAVQVDYRVYTTFNDADGVLRALVQSNVDDVSAGARARWWDGIELPDENLTCILRVERTAG